MMRLRTGMLLLGGMAGLLAQGCGSDGAGVAQVRVVHLSAGLGAVDLLVNGAAAQKGVPEMSVAGYVTVAAGRNRRLVAHSATKGVADVAMTATLEAGKRYDVALFDTGAGREMLVSGFGPDSSFRVVDLAADYSAVDVALLKGRVTVEEAQVQPRLTLAFPEVGSGIGVRFTTVDARRPEVTATLGPDLGGKEAFLTEEQVGGGMVGLRVTEVVQ